MLLDYDSSETINYDYSDYPIYIRQGLLSSYPNYAAPSHWHNDVELIWVLSGRMQYNINGETIWLKKNEGVFINARQMHFGFSASKEECDFLCVLLHPLLLCVTPAYEQDFVLPLIRHPAMPYLHLRWEIPWQKQIGFQIQTMYSVRRKPEAPMKIQAAFMEIWTSLYQHMSSFDTQKVRPEAQLAIVKKMIGFIQQNYGKKLSLASIAASGSVGQSKCCKLFAKYLGQSPNRYLTRYRLNKSMELLKTTDLPIIEIAAETGFCTGSYYTEIFHKWIGKSPTEFRNGSKAAR